MINYFLKNNKKGEIEWDIPKIVLLVLMVVVVAGAVIYFFKTKGGELFASITERMKFG